MKGPPPREDSAALRARGYIVIETLGDLRDNHMGMHAFCRVRDSAHSRKLDIDRLIAHFGADYVYVRDRRIGDECVCLQCGHIGADIIITADTRPTWEREAGRTGN